MKPFFIKSIAILGLLSAQFLFANHCHVEGTVYGIEINGTNQDTLALEGAELFWANTSQGTTTDADGYFHLSKPDPDQLNVLIVRYVSYENDTLYIPSGQILTNIVLERVHLTENVTVEADHAHHMDQINVPINTRTLSQSGLRTLACCNLSESFENTAAVDVEYTDAVSGAKQIKMLGLAGYYTQILIEKNPLMSGFVSSYALDYIPGAWMQSIDISKGVSSVTTGYESITGQINVELKKPENSDPIVLNLYQNSMDKSEGSILLSKNLSPSLSSMIMAYGTQNRKHYDENHDTFLDMPVLSHWNVMNRWSYETEQSHIQWGVSGLRDHRDGGQSAFDFGDHRSTDQVYGFHNQTDRVQYFLKAGRMLDHDHENSIGITLSGFSHSQKAFWGIKDYQGDQQNFYANLIYLKQKGIRKLSAGLSMLADNKSENYDGTDYNRDERVPGAFVEYSISKELHWTAMAGIRVDHHNLFGDLVTPRFHIKYHLSPLTYLRASAGKGFRNPNVFAENLSLLASSRQVVFLEEPRMEEAWNYGFQFYHDFVFASNRPVSLIVDYYRTDFKNQVIIDQDQDIASILIYNLHGKSYSNSFQAEINATVLPGLDMTAAWRMNDVKTTFGGTLLDQPMTSKYKGLFVFSYTFPDQNWQIDMTAQFNGKTRLPNTEANPENYKREQYSPAYPLLFGQIKRKMGPWEMYLGMENISNYTQKDPILAWQDPFGPYFNSSMVWGPTIGRRVYIGVRFN